jgi:two-component system, cell cycle response regulator
VRVSRNAFTNLAVSMIGFGVVTGIAFPFAVLVLGVPASSALTFPFFVFTIAAGILVGGVNIMLTRVLVRPRLTLMARRMEEVEEGLKAATYTGDWTKCDPDVCALPVDSDDEFGAAAAAFNRLLLALAESHKVESRLSDFTHAMSAELDVDAICAAAIDSFRRDLGAAGVAIIGGTAGELQVLASHGISDPATLVTSDLVANAIRSLNVDSMSVPEHLVIDATVAKLTPRHVVVYPLVLKGAAIGAVVLASSSEVPKSAQALGPLFIRTLSVALSNAVSHESIQRIASIDPLTGSLNRRAGLLRLRHDYLHSIRSDKPIAVVMIDIDHFKVVNDTHGHLIGDVVLSGVTDAIGSVLRSDDFIVRYGGEEFLVVLPGAAVDDVAAIAERIRQSAEDYQSHADGTVIDVTVSVGFASTSDLAVEDEMDLVAQADSALFRAKRIGRNRTVSASAA